MTIGLFGGAFDPPHRGHLALVEAAERELGLDGVVVIVTADPGHKEVVTPVDLRVALARAAFPGHEVVVDGHARTVDMLRAHPEWEGATFLVGADQFAGFLGWKEPREVVRLARLGVATRPGYPADGFSAILAQLGEPDRVRFFEIEPWPVSSTELRTRLAAGGDVRDLVPDRVAELITRDGLYRVPGEARLSGYHSPA